MLPKELALTLIMDGRTAASQQRTKYVEYFKHWESSVLADMRNLIHDDPIPESVEHATDFGYQATEACRYRSFLLTKGGRLGLGPAQVAPESLIYLIHGLKVPFVLQKLPADEEYLLRGECYVHGLMDMRAVESESVVYLAIV